MNNTLVVDDIVAITNPKIRAFSSVTEHPFGFVQPLIYYVTVNLFGPNATIFRLVNITFHTGTVWMIFLLLSFMKNRVTAFLTASLYAVHPVLVESITWISGGSYTKYSFFIIVSLFFYISSNNKKLYYWLSVLFYLLSLNTFEKAIVFPGILLIYEIAFFDIKKTYKRLIPFFIITLCFAFLILFPIINQNVSHVQKSYGTGPAINNPFILIPYSLTSYLRLIVWPDNLSLYHPHSNLSIINFTTRLIIALVFFGSLFYFFKKNRLIFFWLCFFVISISYTFFPIKLFWIVAERYAYLGSLGIIFVGGYALSKLIEKDKTRSLGWALFVIIVISLMARTMVRNLDWKNSETLWLATVRSYPLYYQGHYSLGVEYEETGRLEEAKKEYEIAMKLNPQEPRSYANLGSIYLKTKNIPMALEMSEKAIKLNSLPWEPYQNIGVIYFIQRDYDKAAASTKKAIERVPENSNQYIKSSSELYFNLGVIFYKKGDNSKAKEYFNKALQINPKNQIVQKFLKGKSL